VALGRATDADARAGGGPRCPDLLEHATPRRLTSVAGDLAADQLTGASELVVADPG
jgi:hypothetical protein